MTDDTEPIGAALRRLREQRGLGIKTVGKQLNVSYSYLSKVENGHRTPNEEFVARLSALYETDVEDLLATMAELPPDIQDIVRSHGKEVFTLLRDLYGNSRISKKRER